MTRSWSIFLPGDVPTKGSYLSGKRGKVRSACAWLDEWTGWACAEVVKSDPPTWERHQPVFVQMQIAVKRPDSHFTKAGKLNATGRLYPAPTRREDGDWDKHERAVFDMLVMAGVLADDADVVGPGAKGGMFWAKQWSPGIRITIKDVSGYESDAIHKAVAHPRHPSSIALLCGPDGDWFLPAFASVVAADAAYEVTCAACRELLGMSKGIR